MPKTPRTDSYYVYNDTNLSIGTRIAIINIDIQALQAKIAVMKEDVEILERKLKSMKKEELEELSKNTTTNAGNKYTYVYDGDKVITAYDDGSLTKTTRKKVNVKAANNKKEETPVKKTTSRKKKESTKNE